MFYFIFEGADHESNSPIARLKCLVLRLFYFITIKRKEKFGKNEKAKKYRKKVGKKSTKSNK